MQEQRTEGPHSYLAGYVVLVLGAVLAIVAVIFFSLKTFWGDSPIEKCELRIERLAQRLQQEYRADDGSLPESLQQLQEANLTRCPYCRDEAEATANYRYRKLSRDTFELECSYKTHRVIGTPDIKNRYRTSLTEDLVQIPNHSETPPASDESDG